MSAVLAATPLFGDKCEQDGSVRLRNVGGSPLSILLDGYNLALQKGTGVSTYARNLAHSLRSMGCQLGVVYGAPIVESDDALLREVKFFDSPSERGGRFHRVVKTISGLSALRSGRVFSVPRTGAVVTRGLGSRFTECDDLWNANKLFIRANARYEFFRRVSRLSMDERPDVMHWTYPLPIRLSGCPNIYTLHDLVPLRLPYTTLDRKATYLSLMRWIVKTSDHIVTVSECSRRDIIELLGVPEKRITNTYQAVTIPPEFLEQSDAEVAAEVEGIFGLGAKDFYLFFGSIEPKKNVPRLVEAYLSSGSYRPLVIVGAPGWGTEHDAEILKTLPGVDRHVLHIEYLPYKALIGLIRMSRAVLFPSLYEGFGLPILEAMLVGAPVLTSNTAASSEVAGGGALLVDPYDVRAISTAIQALDTSDELCMELSERGYLNAPRFSEAEYRKRLAPVYGQVIGTACR